MYSLSPLLHYELLDVRGKRQIHLCNHLYIRKEINELLEHQLTSRYIIGFMNAFKIILTTHQVWSFRSAPITGESTGSETEETCSGDLIISGRALKSVSLPLQPVGLVLVE